MKRSLAFFISCIMLFFGPAEAVAPQDGSSYNAVISSETPEEYNVQASTPTRKQLRQMRGNRPRKAPIRQLKAMKRKIERVIKKTSPNPNVQGPRTSPLPANAPEMPKAPQMPPLPSAAERFFGAVSKIMTKPWGPNIFVRFPAVSTDPNTGPTGGVLPVLVLA